MPIGTDKSQEKLALPSQSPGKRAPKPDRSLLAVSTILQVNTMIKPHCYPYPRTSAGCCSGRLWVEPYFPSHSAVTRLHFSPVSLWVEPCLPSPSCRKKVEPLPGWDCGWNPDFHSPPPPPIVEAAPTQPKSTGREPCLHPWPAVMRQLRPWSELSSVPTLQFHAAQHSSPTRFVSKPWLPSLPCNNN